MQTNEKRPLMIANGWIQAAGIVLIIGFFIMGVLTYYTYNDEPPIPQTVKDSHGDVLFTRADVMAGQGIFLGNGLMEYGSISDMAPIWGRISPPSICTARRSPVSTTMEDRTRIQRDRRPLMTSRRIGMTRLQILLSTPMLRPTPLKNAAPTTRLSLEIQRPDLDSGRTPSAIRSRFANSPLSSVGLRGRLLQPGQGTYILTLITGLRSRSSITTLPPIQSSGVFFRSPHCWAEQACCWPHSAAGIFSDGMDASSRACPSALPMMCGSLPRKMHVPGSFL